MVDKRVGSFFSLAMKAGKLATGEFSCEKTMQKGLACLVVIASDASDNTKKKFTNKAFYYKIPVCVYGTRQELSKYVGQDNRAVFIITDIHFGKKMKEMIDNNHT